MKPGIGLIGRKLGMTQIFREDGRPVPVTVLEAGPCTVVQAKEIERDRYRAVQLAFGEIDPRRLTQPLLGHFKKGGISPKRILREFRIGKEEQFAVGSSVTVELFKPGDRVDVTGRSIGKGFQGGVKRWHWKGGPQTHGSMSHRAPGSIGSSTNPSRVFKGHHLPGHMGNRRVTTQGLEVIQVDPAQNLLLVKGAVPGHDEAQVLIRRSRKRPRLPVAPQPAKKKAALQAAKPPAAKGQVPAKGQAPAKQKKPAQ